MWLAIEKRDALASYIVGSVLLSLPFSRVATSWAIIVLFVFWIIFYSVEEKNIGFKYVMGSKLLWLLPILYLWLLLGIIYSSDIHAGFFDVQIKFYFILFTFILPCLSVSKTTVFSFLNRVFVFGVFLACIGCLGYAFYRSIHLTHGHLQFVSNIGYDSYFYYQLLSIFIHPTYFSMFITMASAIVLFNLNKKQKVVNYASKVLLLMLFSTTVFLLSSRSGLIIYIVVFSIGIAFGLKRYFKTAFLPALITLALLSIAIIFAVKYNERISRTISVDEVKDIVTLDKKSIHTSNNRILIWFQTINIIKEHAVIGVGTGDIQECLNESYVKAGIKDGAVSNMNTHNQYLDIFLKIGIPGGMFFISILILLLIKAIKSYDLIFIQFIIIFASYSLFENLLSKQIGVVFFSFYIVFMLLPREKSFL